MIEYILIGYLVAAIAFFLFIVKDVKKGDLNIRIVTFFIVLSVVWPFVILMYYLLGGMGD